MAIDLVGEHIIPLKEAAKFLPRRNGKTIHYSTLWRWAHRGLRGVKLETLRLSGTVTSTEALQRFAEALTTGEVAKPRPCTRHQRAVEIAERELERAGF